MRVIPSIVFSLIGYFMTGLQRTAGQFFVVLITIFMASVFGSAICFFISAAIPVFGKYNDCNTDIFRNQSFCLFLSCGSNCGCTGLCHNVGLQWFYRRVI